MEKAQAVYQRKEQEFTPPLMRELERVIMLRVVDEYWMDQIDAMNDLKQGIGLRAYAQTDPVVAYKKEGYEMFEQMIAAIQEETLRRLNAAIEACNKPRYQRRFPPGKRRFLVRWNCTNTLAHFGAACYDWGS